MNKKAFTLIELLVVVAIIGILAAVGVVAYNGYTGSAKVRAATFNHKLAVKDMKTLLFSCETQGFVTLKTNLNGSTSDFQCSTGADNLRQQFTFHFYLNGFRNLWTFRKGVTVKGVTLDNYMIGYSCSTTPALGFTDICNESFSKLRIKTNVGTPNGGTQVLTDYIEIE